MLSLIRPSLMLMLICLQSTAVFAQRGLDLPSEKTLNQYGLTMMWWGQSTIDPSRDKVLFVTNDEQNVYVQGSSGIVTTFSGEGGKKLWANLIGQPDQVGYPATSNDELLLVAVGLRVFALDKVTGEPMWDLRIANSPSAAPEVDDNQIYVGTVDGSVYSYNLHRVRQLNTDGLLPQWANVAKMWRFKTPNEIVSQPVAIGPTVSFASKSGILYGLGTVDKGLKFQFETDGKIHTGVGRAKDHVFIADSQSRMYCLNKNNGQVNWSYSSGAPILQQPRSTGRRVYAVPQREGLVALSIVSGRLLWQQQRATEFLAASETRIYASDLSGNLLILNKEDGTIIGAIPMRKYSLRINNDRTDRLVLATQSGLVISLREQGSEFPVFHLYPDRQPILPLFADEEGATPDDMADIDATQQ